MSSREKVILVGSFKAASDGTVGGVGYRSLSLVHSDLSRVVDWLPVESVMKSLPPPNVAQRSADGVRLLREFASLIGRERPDRALILSSFRPLSLALRGSMAIIAKRMGVGLVALSLGSEIRPQRGGIAFHQFVQFVVDHCDVVLCQSSRAKLALSDMFVIHGRAEIVPNWIDGSRYRSLSRPQPVGDHVPRILSLSWLVRGKGVHDLLDAASILKSRDLRFHVDVVGGGPEMDALRRQVAAHHLESHVTFHGWVYDEAKLERLRLADIFVLPTYSEGMPNALLEAMASGLPVVTTPVGGIPDMIVDGHGGSLVDPGSPSQLADALAELLGDRELRRLWGNQNREKVQECFDYATAIPRVARALDLPWPPAHEGVDDAGLEGRAQETT